MAKRGGLGRGLDSLIPNRVSKSKAPKYRENEVDKKPKEQVSLDTKNLDENSSDGAASSKKSSLSKKSQKNLSKKTTLDMVAPEKETVDENNLTEELHTLDSFSSDDIIDGSSDNSSVDIEKAVNSADSQAEVFEDSANSIESGTEKNSAGRKLNSGNNFDSSKQLDQLEEQAEGQKGKIVSLRISSVEPNRSQPRKYFDEAAIDELADSIEKFGIISPLLVQKKDDYYEIIAGERRWRAAKRAGLKEVPVIIKDFSDKEAVEVSLIENIQREDLNPIEEAKAYERLVKEYGMNQEEVAGRVSKSRSAVTNSMRLLKLADHVQKLVENGSLSEGHARALVPLDDPSIQEEVAHQIVENRLSVRQTELLVKNLLKPDKPGRKKSRDVRQEAMLKDLAEHLKHKFGTKVNIKPSGKNKGKIEIEYYSDEELDRIYELLQSVR